MKDMVKTAILIAVLVVAALAFVLGGWHAVLEALGIIALAIYIWRQVLGE